MVYRGFSELRNFGKPTGNIETTTSLVASGIYKYIRHPLYGSLIFLGAGCFFKNPSLLATSLFSVSTVFFMQRRWRRNRKTYSSSARNMPFILIEQECLFLTFFEVIKKWKHN
jgi:protein-S-isoprenylcysteine O-methyltransferase Ste14